MQQRLCCLLIGTIAVMSLPAGHAAAAPPAASKPAAAEPGLITTRSKHVVAETIELLENAIRAKDWYVFTLLDHAAAARNAGLELRARTVVIFGNPKIGTEAMQKHPTLAIDLPLKALVWQDDDGVVWVTMNSADYVATKLYPRHDMIVSADTRKAMQTFLDGITREATQ